MWYVILFITFIIVALVVSRLAYVRGEKKGYDVGYKKAEEYWEQLRNTPIAGMTVEVPTFGYVMILGRGDNTIDVIPQSVLNGRFPSELSDDELDKNTISYELDEFVANVEIPLSVIT